MNTKKPLIINGIGKTYLEARNPIVIDGDLCKQCTCYDNCLASCGFTMPICYDYKEENNVRNNEAK